MNKKKSFTLIELLVVIVIIGVLAGLIVVGVTNSISQAQDAKIKATMLELSKALKMNSLDSFPIETTACNLKTSCTTLKSALNIPGTQDDIYYKTSSSGNFFVIYATKPSETNLSFEINSNIEEVKEVPSFSNLVAYYPLSMGASNGTTISDMSPNSNHGTNHGATFGGGVDGNGSTAMIFDGANDYIEKSELNTTALMNGSVSIWINPDISMSTEKHPISLGGIQCFYTGSTLFVGFSGSYITYTINLKGSWHHVVYAFNASSTKIYIDSVLAISSPNIIYTSANPKISIGSYSSGSYYWKGLIDDVRVYNGALSADEIKLLYNNRN